MAKDKRDREQDEQKDAHKLHADYNLEKLPLSAGRREPRVGLRERAAMGLKDWALHRSMGGWLVMLLIALLVIAGALTIYFATGFFNAYFLAE